MFEYVLSDSTTGIQQATVSWIDRVPKATFNYSPASQTTGSVTATISFDQTGVTITNTNFAPCLGGSLEVLSGACTFVDNGTFTFEFINGEGWTGSATAKVDWIYDLEDLFWTREATTNGQLKQIYLTVNPSTSIVVDR